MGKIPKKVCVMLGPDHLTTKFLNNPNGYVWNSFTYPHDVMRASKYRAWFYRECKRDI